MERAKKALPLLAILFLAMLVERRAFRTRCQSANRYERARSSNPQPRLCLR